MSVRRNVLNVVRNYSDAEIKVREATSNDAWGPSSSLMSEIADMTYNVAAFSDIMTMIWKRVNDHGKNWRHVYKALVLLDYLIKTGSERVSTQCKENIYAIQTLKDFQFIDRDAKDQGVNVREKSKQLVSLLKDDERLKLERARALKAKERFAQATTGIGSDRTIVTGFNDERRILPLPGTVSHRQRRTVASRGSTTGRKVVYGHGSSTPLPATKRTETPTFTQPQPTPPTNPAAPVSEIEQARPHTATEEELQLQLALTMSKEEAEMEKKKQESDQVRLELAISESQKLTQQKPKGNNLSQQQHQQSSSGAGGKTLVDLSAAARTLENPWGDQGGQPAKTNDPFFSPNPPAPAPVANDPWSSVATSVATSNAAATNNDPWGLPSTANAAPASDPWSTQQPTVATGGGDDFDPFGFSSTSAPVQQPLVQQNNTAASSSTAAAAASQDILSFSNNQDLLSMSSISSVSNTQQQQPQSLNERQKKSAEDFLGGALNLVNLDSLVTRPAPNKQATVNPFLSLGANNTSVQQQQQQNAAAVMSLNQMRGAPVVETNMTTISVVPTMTQPTMMQPAFMQQQNMFQTPAADVQPFGAFPAPSNPAMMQPAQQSMFSQQPPSMMGPPMPLNPSPWGAPAPGNPAASQMQSGNSNNNPFLL